MERLLPQDRKKSKLFARLPWSLIALCVPALLFPAGLWWLHRQPTFEWLCDVKMWPWEFWLIALAGLAATAAGIADWRWHRSVHTAIGAKEHQSELLALAGGGIPLFLVMAWASLSSTPHVWLVPILVLALF